MKIEFRPIAETDDVALLRDLFNHTPDFHGTTYKTAGMTDEEFAAWIKETISYSDPKNVPADRVPTTKLILWIDDIPVARADYRHWLTPTLEIVGGHVGYNVSSKHRGKKYAILNLAKALEYIRQHNPELKRVLITCNDENIASWKTIEKNGGVLEKTYIVPEGHGKYSGCIERRYWVEL